MKIQLLSLATSAIIFASCGGESPKSVNTTPTEQSTQHKIMSLPLMQLAIQWLIWLMTPKKLR